MNDAERLLVQGQIASFLDYPSVYMGGPSSHSMRKADKLIAILEQGKRLVSTTCTHESWKDYLRHGTYCPDCLTLLPGKAPDTQ